MIIGGLADSTGFGAAEIDSMDAQTATWWWNCIMTYRKAVNEEA